MIQWGRNEDKKWQSTIKSRCNGAQIILQTIDNLFQNKKKRLQSAMMHPLPNQVQQDDLAINLCSTRLNL